MATEKRAASELHVETADRHLEHLKDAGLHDKTLNNDALEATVQEHSLGVIQGLKTYKRAAFWSIRTFCHMPPREPPGLSTRPTNSTQSSRPASSWKATT